MNRGTVFIVTVGLCAAVCELTAQAPLKSDGVPPHGALRLGDRGQMDWREQLAIATSTDGIAFVRTGNVVSDRAKSPSVVVRADALYLYYLGAMRGSTGRPAVAISRDRGATWIFRHVTISEDGGVLRPTTLYALALRDGGFRLYFCVGEQRRIFYADGTDGVHFSRGDADGIDSTRHGSPITGVLLTTIGEAWHIFVREGNYDCFGTVLHSLSGDASHFAFTSRSRVEFDGGPDPCHPTSAVRLPDGRTRFYGSPNGAPGGIRSFVTRDGATFEPEPGSRLVLDESRAFEKEFVKDAAVAQLGDGTYIMVYVTGIP